MLPEGQLESKLGCAAHKAELLEEGEDNFKLCWWSQIQFVLGTLVIQLYYQHPIGDSVHQTSACIYQFCELAR